MREMSGAFVGLLSLSLVGAAQAGDVKPTWDANFWNPKEFKAAVRIGDYAIEPDVILPMPCGGAMAFRRARTVLPPNWMEDARIRVGDDHARSGGAPAGSKDAKLSAGDAAIDNKYADYTRFAHVAGSLSEGDDPTKRFYLIGKYEVTTDQYAAVMTGNCPTPSMEGRVPVANISWFDAVAFTRAYTEWLLSTAKPALIANAGQSAFVRLPTEDEWEFAARGAQATHPGAEVAYLDRTFGVKADDLNRYVAFQGPSSCQGDLQPVGTREPNPLGLFDILGNVDEMTLEPFHLTRAEREHGASGGLVLRGGSCETDRGQISVSSRIETGYFDDRTGKAWSAPMTGFRVVVDAMLQVSHKRAGDYRSGWEKLSGGAADAGSDGKPPAERLEAAAKSTSDPAAEKAMREVAVAIRQDASTRADIEGRAVQATIRSGAFVIRQYRDDSDRLRNAESALSKMSGGNDAENPTAAKIRASVEDMRSRRNITTSIYAELLQRAADDYDEKRVDDAVEVVVKQYKMSSATSIADFAAKFGRQVKKWRSNHGGDIVAYLGELVE